MTRAQESNIAMKIQKALGNDYTVNYDMCESGFTYFYYRRIFYKMVPNDAMSAERIDVNEYAAPMEVILQARSIY